MKFKGITKKEEGRFITRYDLEYETIDHQKKVYEMISRNKQLESFEDISNHKAEAVVMIMFNEDESKILLNKEYRMACGCYVYNFPAGLIEEGEDEKSAAKRELVEETGLTIIQINDIIRDSFSAVGFSNEKNICVVGKAIGTLQQSSSTVEEIEANWYSKEEVRELLNKEYFAARTQGICYMWAKQ